MEDESRSDHSSEAQEKARREERRTKETEKRLKRNKTWITIKGSFLIKKNGETLELAQSGDDPLGFF